MADSKSTNDPKCCFKISSRHTNGYVEVYGPGNMNVAPVLKDICYAMINEGKKTIFINLKNCQIVDSTFMGTLVNIQERFAKVGTEDGKLMMFNLNEDHHRLFEMVGISEMLQILSDEVEVPDFQLKTIEFCDVDREEKLGVVVEAHEKLVELNKINKQNFDKFLSIVKQEIKEEEIDSKAEATTLNKDSDQQEKAAEAADTPRDDEDE